MFDIFWCAFNSRNSYIRDESPFNVTKLLSEFSPENFGPGIMQNLSIAQIW